MADNTMAPVLPSDLNKELNLWMEDMEIFHEMQKKLKELAAGIHNTGNVMYQVMQVFGMFQEMQGAQMRTLADVDNINTTLRNEFSGAQSNFNGITGGDDYKTAKAEAQKIINMVKEIQAFIDQQKGSSNPVIDKGTLNNLENALKSIKENFGSSWGNTAAMADRVSDWIHLAKKGVPPVHIKNINDAFHTLNNSASALSATTNSKLQFVENQFKQALGMENSAIQTYQKLNSSLIQNQRSR